MITLREAERIAKAQLALDLFKVDKPQLMLQHTITKDYGWVFFYQSAEFLRTGDFRHAIAGNAPFLVEKSDGRVVMFGTGQPLESYLAEYEQGRWPRRKR